MNDLINRIALLVVFFSVIVFACQEEEMTAEIPFDEDMELALELADDYLTKKGGRASKSEKSITVLKFKDGVLLYDTNRDTVKHYQEVTEMTVTAHAKPGEYVFWFAGGGVSDLQEIDFDDVSDEILKELLEEINADHMWVVQVPEDLDHSIEYFKYDIVYQYKAKNTKSPYIRLDPKIRVVQGSNPE
ncbi:MAG: hypothetical protein Tsb0034_06920 [Ekhidna sp.]